MILEAFRRAAVPADPLSKDDVLAPSGLTLAMADIPPEVPPSGGMPPGKTKPAVFLQPMRETPAEQGGAPRAVQTMGQVFAKRINDLVGKLPDTAGHVGKVSIGELYDAYRQAYPREGVGQREFGFRLVNAAKRRDLAMSRLDLPERMDKDLRLRSETPWGSDTVHFVNKPPR